MSYKSKFCKKCHRHEVLQLWDPPDIVITVKYEPRLCFLGYSTTRIQSNYFSAKDMWTERNEVSCLIWTPYYLW